MYDNLIQSIQEISSELGKTSEWDIAGVVIGGVSAVLTILVLLHNHKAIKLTQHSVKQAVGLQLYEKRLELYSALYEDMAFERVPISLKIVYSKEIYNLYAEISKLCHERNEKISEYNMSLHEPFDISFNVCRETMQKIEQLMNTTIQELQQYETTKRQADTLKQLQHYIELYTDAIMLSFYRLERKMEQILKDSLDIKG